MLDAAGTLRTDRLFLHWTDSGIWAALSVRPAAKCWPGSTSASEWLISAVITALLGQNEALHKVHTQFLSFFFFINTYIFYFWVYHSPQQGWRPLLWERLPDPFWSSVWGVSSVHHRESARGMTQTHVSAYHILLLPAAHWQFPHNGQMECEV